MNTNANTKMMYLQEEFNGMPAGTPVVECEPSTQHLMAKAMLGGKVVPTTYVRVIGSDEVIAVPLFKGLLGECHPTDPRVVGPFVANGEVVEDFDKLHVGCFARVVYKKDYPWCSASICFDETQPNGSVVFDTTLNMVDKIGLLGKVATMIEDRRSSILA